MEKENQGNNRLTQVHLENGRSVRVCVCVVQTGSGKTFTITGGAERYADRGIIPRALSYVFDYYEKVALSSGFLFHYVIDVVSGM